MKLVLTIAANQWTDDNAKSFVEWLDNELLSGNMTTEDDARVEEYKLIQTTE